MITTHVIISLLLILTSAWILGSLFDRIGIPAILGELTAGIILGPPVLGLVGSSAQIELLAELGIFFAMFHSGMEMDPKELIEHIKPSMAVAIGGFVVPFILGYFVTRTFGGTINQSLFVGMGVSITAIAVQAVILHALQINRTPIGHIILGAAIIDDILALMALSVLLALAKTGTLQLQVLGAIVLKVALFFGATILVGHFIMPRFTRRLTDKGGKAFTFAMASALLMAFFAELAGLHLIIGAFLAGQFVREEIVDPKIYESLNDRFEAIAYGFLLPIFFVSLSFHLQIIWSLSFLLFASAIVFAATVGKLVGCSIGAVFFKFSAWEIGVIGFGMNGRGAIELVVATVVIKLSDSLMQSNLIDAPLLTGNQFSALVLMAFVTTFLAPIALKWAAMRACLSDEQAEFCMVWDNAKAG